MDSKNIKDYLHLYLGCQVHTEKGIATLITVGMLGSDLQSFRTIMPGMSVTRGWEDSNMLILRPLSDMTEEEAKDLCRMQIKGIRWTDGIKIIQMKPTVQFVIYSLGENVSNDYGRTKRFLNIESYLVPQFKYLLSKGFDLFGLIDAGLAIKKSD